MSGNIELAWAIPNSDDFDVKDFALRLLEQAKENLQRDSQLVSAAFVITPGELQCYSVTFRSQEEKTVAYDELVRAAQEAQATALITCNDAYIKDRADQNYMEGYYPGKLAVEGAKECILLTVSGPQMESWSVEVPYQRSEKGIEFGPQSESFGDDLGFLTNWGSGKPRIN